MKRVGARRAVVVCGKTIARDGHLIELVRAALGDAFGGVYDGVASHTPLDAVLEAAEALRELQADAVIAVGGGSAAVSARAAVIALAEGTDIHSLSTTFVKGEAPISPRLAKPKLPVFGIPTTPSTAFAKAGTAVLDAQTRRRLTMFDPNTRCGALFFHPEFAASAPSSLVLDAALNAFTMCLLGLEAASREPIADSLLLQGLRMLLEGLDGFATSPENPAVRGALMVGALLAGQGTDYTQSGLALTLGHCIGLRCHVPGGAVNMLILPHTIRFNASATGERLRDAVPILGARTDLPAAESVARACEDLADRLGCTRRLSQLGVSATDFDAVLMDAADDWFLHQNPRKIVDVAELFPLLKGAL